MIINCINVQEAAVNPPDVAFAVRQNPGCWEYVKVRANDLSVDAITSTEYLKFKELIYDEKWYIYLHVCVSIYLSSFNIISHSYKFMQGK